jgi:hypothetical protein
MKLVRCSWPCTVHSCIICHLVLLLEFISWNWHAQSPHVQHSVTALSIWAHSGMEKNMIKACDVQPSVGGQIIRLFEQWCQQRSSAGLLYG